MTFNSMTYAVFLPVVFLLYWYGFRSRLKAQNLFIVLASYIFYGFWDWRFLILIIFTTFTTFFTARRMNDGDNRKGWLVANVIVNVGVLFVFKYLNFFAESARALMEVFGFGADWTTLNILLPIGISFYTFQAISYSVDVYRRKIEPTSDYVAFSAHIAFFPQLVAGPIERSTSLLPQILAPRKWDYALAVDGMRQILWGLFKKVAVADLCGVYVDRILSDLDYYGGSTILLALILFCFQIYGDFSGYSDIAIGSAKLFGIRLSPNFHYPYFSSSIREFWQRWHISLMTWLRDYIYIPLGGARRGNMRTYVNLGIVFLLSGLWHGAAWTYVLWGAVWGLAYIVERAAIGKEERPFSISSLLYTACLILITMSIFRAPSVSGLCDIFSAICSPTLLEIPTGVTPFVTIIPMLLFEYVGRKKEFPLSKFPVKLVLRWLVYAVLAYAVVFAIDESSSQFIYFQF